MTTIKLEGKEYQIDIEQAKKLNLLKEKDNRVKSWKEFIEKYRNEYGYFYAANENKIFQTVFPIPIANQLTPHEAKAMSAFSKLLKFRRDWIGEWEPDWSNSEFKHLIVNWGTNLKVEYSQILCRPLSFPTKKMAHEFLKTFRDLIEEAKILI